MARKGWDLLSANYRKKLLRGGITESAYASGTPYPWRAKERQNREQDKFVKEYTRYASQDADRVRDRLRTLPPYRAHDYMTHTRKMAELYSEGQATEAHRLWELRDKSLPDYMHYYHGVFGF